MIMIGNNQGVVGMIQVQSVRMHDLLSFVYYSNKYHQVVGSSSGQDNNKEKKSIHRSIEACMASRGRTDGGGCLPCGAVRP